MPEISNQQEFFDAWGYIENHPISVDKHGTSYINQILVVDVVKVDPDTERIADIRSKNTKVRIWLEYGPLLRPGEPYFPEGQKWPIPTHDVDLDCGGNTFEEAVIKLAGLIKDAYGPSTLKVIGNQMGVWPRPI
jgi:hypothetical protein